MAIGERADACYVDVLTIVWGTTIGLTLAHLFAFRLSAKLVASGKLHLREGGLAAAQLVGAIAVAVIATLPVLLLPSTAALDVARLVLSGFIATLGFAMARNGGASRGRSAVYASAVLIAAATIAITKNVLSGH